MENKGAVESYTDCREENGIAVGLIDGVIAMFRVLAKMDLTDQAIREAILDLKGDEDFAFVMNEK